MFDINNPECVIDGFLAHQSKEETARGDHQLLTDDILIVILMDIFEAGESKLIY